MEEKIIYLLRNLFIKKECDLTDLKVISAIATAVCGISHLSSIITPKEAQNTVLRVFKASDNIKINELLKMEPNDVNNLIGFKVNFRDINDALNEYEQNKEQYEELFHSIKELLLSLNSSN